MNEFVQRVRENLRTIIIGFVFLLIVAVVVGLAIGMAKRGTRREKLSPLEELLKSPQGSKAHPEQGKSSFFLPRPIIPELQDEYSGYIFYFDRERVNPNRKKIVTTKLPDLLRHKGIGVQSSLRPFRFNNEEFDILDRDDSPAEP